MIALRVAFRPVPACPGIGIGRLCGRPRIVPAHPWHLEHSAGMALLELKSVTLSLGGPKVLDRVDLSVEKGERLCLLGRNGEGKTTLLRLLAGEMRPDEGEVLRASGSRTGLLPQEVPADLRGPVREVVAGGLARTPRAGRGRGLAAGTPGRTDPRAQRPGRDGGVHDAVGGQPTARPAGARAGQRARDAVAGRAHQPPGHRRHRLARRPAAAVRRHAVLRHPRPRLPARTGRAHPGDRPRPPARLGLRLRHLPAPPRRIVECRTRAVGRVRPQAGRGRGVDPPGRARAAHAQRGPRARPAGDARGAARPPRADRRRGAAAAGRRPQRQDGAEGRAPGLRLGRQGHRPRFQHDDPARRPRRPAGPQRRRQDHAAAAAAGPPRSRRAVPCATARTCRSPTWTSSARNWTRARPCRRTSAASATPSPSTAAACT